jgi:hypothetical protein
MKTYLLLGLLAILLLPKAVFAEEAELSPQKQMEIRNIQLDLEEREMEMDFQRKNQELELQDRSIEMEREYQKKEHYAGYKHHKDKDGKPILVLLAIVHILLAVWVFQDIRKKTDSSGIWIVIALLTGLLGVLVYAIVRLGDIRKTSA